MSIYTDLKARVDANIRQQTEVGSVTRVNLAGDLDAIVDAMAGLPQVAGVAINVAINVNSALKQVEVTATANSVIYQHKNKFVPLTANTPLVHVNNATGTGVNIVAFNTLDNKVYLINNTSIATITTDYVVLGFLYGFGLNVLGNSDITVDGVNTKRNVYNSVVFDGRIRVDRTNKKVVIPSTFYYLESGKAFVKKNAKTDFGNDAAFTFALQTGATIVDTIWFSPDLLAAGSNPFFIESSTGYTNRQRKEHSYCSNVKFECNFRF
jgi:hypothetical protein